MTPDLPFEFNVPGIPVSLQGSVASRDAWKSKIRQAARAHLPEGAWSLEIPVEVTILFLSGDAMSGDLDNRIKPILDALSGPVLLDDRLVDRLVVQRFAPSESCQILSPSPVLISAIWAGEPIVYIRVDDDPNREREL
jgi:hypothetical protein